MATPHVRAARADDLDEVVALLVDRGEPADGLDLRLLAETEGLDGTGVVEVDGAIAATATLLDEELRVGCTLVACGQVELVATHRDHEHRGHVRALMDWCHARSATRGHVVQVMIGIPYFYRRFGYHYAIPMHAYAPLSPHAVVAPADLTVRRANAHDVAAMAALQDATQSRFDVTMPHQPSCWQWLVQRDGSHQYVTVDERGLVVGTARWTDVEDGVVLVAEVASTSTAATHALLAAAAAPVSAGEVRVQDRPGVPGLAASLGERQRRDWFYVRVPDVAALLDVLSPTLETRLAASPLAGLSTDLLVSLWERHVSITIADGQLGAVRRGGPHQRPVSSGGSGLPPDAVGHLVFGGGAAALEERFPDAHLGRQRELMQVLFPPQHADLLTFYLPS